MATKSKSESARGSEEFLPLLEVIADFKPEIVQGVREQVIPYLIREKLLEGKTAKGETFVKVDDRFQRLMRFGIENFVVNQQGWTFVAVKASVDAVAQALQKRKNVSYRKDVGAIRPKTETMAAMEKGKQHTFLVHFPGSDWSILIITVHWSGEETDNLAMTVAQELSRELRGKTIAGLDNDAGGSGAIVYENGKQTAQFYTEEDDVAFDALFYKEGIFLPESFIAQTKGGPALMLSDPKGAERVDHVVFTMED